MPGIGQQGQGTRNYSPGGLDHHEGKGQKKDEPETAPNIFRGVVPAPAPFTMASTLAPVVVFATVQVSVMVMLTIMGVHDPSVVPYSVAPLHSPERSGWGRWQ